MRRKIICLALVACLACGVLGGCQNSDPYGISKEEFDQLRIGMDRDDAVTLISDNVSDDMRSDDYTEERNKAWSYWNLVSESEDVWVYTIKGETQGEAKLTFAMEVDGDGMSLTDYSIVLQSKENNGL